MIQIPRLLAGAAMALLAMSYFWPENKTPKPRKEREELPPPAPQPEPPKVTPPAPEPEAPKDGA